MESGQQDAKPIGMPSLNTRLRACFEEGLNAFVSEALDHPYSVYERYTDNQLDRHWQRISGSFLKRYWPVLYVTPLV